MQVVFLRKMVYLQILMGFEKEHITYEQLVELVKMLSNEQKQKLVNDAIITGVDDAIEKAILEDFKKYEETFKALA